MAISQEQQQAIAQMARNELSRRYYKNYVVDVHFGQYQLFPHTELICNYLQRIADGEQLRIIIEMPPRHSKSMTVTETFPSYYLGRNPNKRVITSAYGDGLAKKFGRLNRNKFRENAKRIFNLDLSASNNAITDWGIDGHSGGMISTGIGGSITGQGADCFPEGTMIDTEIGKIDVKELHEMKDKPRVLSYNHFTGSIEYKDIQMTRRKPANDFTKVITVSGNEIISTKEHHYYEFEKGYREAYSFRTGDKLTIPATEKTPQIESDTVQDVKSYEQPNTIVYDLQIADNHNFFANGLLVHNCMIIDDPIKNAKEAQSKTIRDTIWDEWESTLSTRLHKGASVIVIMTRWHEDDMIGRLLDTSPYDWVRLRLPAIAEDKDDLLGREIGEPLCAELGYDKEWAALKKEEVGSRTWASLYQQRPTVAQGNIFKRQWINYFDNKDNKYFDDMLMSWDMTFKDSEEGDYVVGQVWGKKGSEYYLVDQIREQLDFTNSLKAVENMARKYPRCRRILIEDKANGPAIINTLKRKVSGIIPITPKESKEARAFSVTPFFEAGNVYFYNKLPYLDDLVDELVGFPQAAHD